MYVCYWKASTFVRHVLTCVDRIHRIISHYFCMLCALVQGQFVKNGGVLLENCKVEKIVPGTSVKLYTSKGVITTRHLVITAGEQPFCYVQMLSNTVAE